MTTLQLYAFGCDPTKIHSKSAVSYTSDGINWSRLPETFKNFGFNLTASTDGVNWTTTSNHGEGSYSNDLINWNDFELENKSWLVTKIKWANNKFYMIGYEKDLTTFNETAFIATSGNGIDATWVRTWISGGVPSILFDLVYGGNNSWFAVGLSNTNTPLLLHSSNGTFFTGYPLPSQFNSGIYSVEYNQTTNTIWIGGTGIIANANWQGNSTQWTINNRISTNVAKPNQVSKLYNCNQYGVDIIVALVDQSVWYSVDSVDWSVVTNDGYTFSDVIQFNNSLYFSCKTLLNEYTGFSSNWNPSIDSTLTLNGYNNGVQAYAFQISEQTPGTTPTPPPPPPPGTIYTQSLIPVLPNGSRSIPTSLSNDGNTIVGVSGLYDIAEPYVFGNAFLWNSNTGMIDLGVYPGGAPFNGTWNAYYGSFATSVSADGTKVVGFGFDSSSNQRLFYWTSATGLIDMGGVNNYVGYIPNRLPLPEYNISAYISSDGSSVTATATFAIYWSMSSGITVLSPAVGGAYCVSLGISANGSSIIGYSDDPSTGGQVAMLWNNTVATPLGYLSGGLFSQAVGISADGNTIVGYGTTEGGSPSFNNAFIWTQLLGFTNIGSLFPSGTTSIPLAISSDGTTIAGWFNTLGNGNDSTNKAFIWSNTTGIVELGVLPGATYSYATSISSDGSIVSGYSGPFNDTYSYDRAFVWTELSGMIDVGLIPGVGSSEGTSMPVMSADGSIVSGQGYEDIYGTSYYAQLFTWKNGTINTIWGLDSVNYGQSYAISQDGSTVTGSSGINSAFSWKITTDILTAISPTLPSNGVAVSSDGTYITGNTGNYSEYNAFIWSHTTGTTNIGTLVGSQVGSVSTGISSDGSVVSGNCDISYNNYATRWTSGSGLVNLGTLSGGTYSYSIDISHDGSTIIGYADNGVTTNPFIWNSTDGMVDLGILPGSTYAHPTAVSSDGSVVVGYGNSDAYGVFSAFSSSTMHGLVGLSTLPGDAYGCKANAVSSDGSIIVGESYTEAYGVPTHAVLWTSPTDIINLGTLPNSIYGSAATGISGDGTTVVGYSDSYGIQQSFVWTQGSGMVALPLTGGLVRSNIGFYGNNCISYDGSVIAGTAYDSSNVEWAITWKRT